MRYTTAILYMVVLVGCGETAPGTPASVDADESPCLPPLSDPRWVHRGDTAALRLPMPGGRTQEAYSVRVDGVDPAGGEFDIFTCRGYWQCDGRPLTTSRDILSTGPEDQERVCDEYADMPWGCPEGQFFKGCNCGQAGTACIAPESGDDAAD